MAKPRQMMAERSLAVVPEILIHAPPNVMTVCKIDS
jgi:hypothetical protein